MEENYNTHDEFYILSEDVETELQTYFNELMYESRRNGYLYRGRTKQPF